ncbi:nucleotidyltransferase family protein [Methylomagnum sp.]
MHALIEQNREQIRYLAHQRGIRNVQFFGSMANNTATAASDIDLLVELEEGRTGLALGGFLLDVSELLGRKVDVVMEHALHPRIRERVLREAVPV